MVILDETKPGSESIDPSLHDASETHSSTGERGPDEENLPSGNIFDPSQFPDGGSAAWLVVFGAFCFVFCSFGWLNCIGFFQDYYQSHQLSQYSPSTISWIASLEIFMMFAGGPLVGRLYDIYGPHYIVLFGSFMHVFGLMMASISKNYWQILLSQGVCSPIGISCLFLPSSNCVSTWFFKRRAFAIGIVAAGSSVGGVIFPIMLDRLVKQVGFGWALRISAFLILGLLVIGNLTIRSRLPPSPKPLKAMQYFKPLTETPFLLTTIASFMFYFGLFLPINYIQVQAIKQGMSPSLAIYLIPVLNAASIFGRIGPGWVGDKIGRYNTQIITSLFSAVICLALWLPAKSNAALIVFAALYGAGSGAFVSLIPALIAQISDIKEIGLRVGIEFAGLSIAALVSNPIGGAFVGHQHGQYRDMQIWCGLVLLAGSILFMFARVALVGCKVWTKV